MDQKNQKEQKKKTVSKLNIIIIIFFIVILIFLGIFIKVFVFGEAGPPPDYLKANYMLPNSINKPSENAIALSNNSDTNRFILSRRHNMEKFPFFPLFTNNSPGYSYREYTLLKTGDRYIVEAAWFDSRENMLMAENELSEYLEKNGNVSIITLDLQQEFAEAGKASVCQNSTNVSMQYTVTQYEDNTTSGYFIIMENPEKLPWNGYCIIYFGSTFPSDISVHFNYLKTLIFYTIDRSVINKEIEVRPLS